MYKHIPLARGVSIGFAAVILAYSDSSPYVRRLAFLRFGVVGCFIISSPSIGGTYPHIRAALAAVFGCSVSYAAVIGCPVSHAAVLGCSPFGCHSLTAFFLVG